ncbi:electron transport complex subunit RsxB [Gilvimarinus agarilyticus]|uniref:electron transport complex subunit RsxB n=1 Tax=unclassified Gilvimarinus TaxID=2642066 RepID=UPI001C0A6207|nr:MULTISPECIES: electron transport complex subunit RsxB [unclassified Gilvimarinus]MBU2886882.1 electron transport complex subunit RsxB [Gilvimarinus agarilyticus]MDO6571543.1 electron transport complex subunit RsxB [Gilvimarinus sp. 2_MG-2023]MDO6747934.1 electron transport complex subunit RsxB [Gilvimarinus sp. 1_MG-2023]
MLETIAQHPIAAALIALIGLALLFGALLGFAAVRFKVEGDPIVEQIDNLLPQTQCGQCGYPGCRPYAQAIANGDSINKCPPGGQTTINELADLLDVEAPTLDEEHGEEADVATVAVIREDECIGCTKCIQACPMDAILGAAKQMHTVIADECTGCDLCVEPCPVDCIDMIPLATSIKEWRWELPAASHEQADNLIATDQGRGSEQNSGEAA